MKPSRHVVLSIAVAITLLVLSGLFLGVTASSESSPLLRLDWGKWAHISAERVLAAADRSSPRAAMQSFMTNMNAGHQRLQTAKLRSRAVPGFLAHSPEILEEAGRALYHYERAMHCLDFSGVPQIIRLQEARESVLLLKEILDRVGIPPYDQIPGMEEVAAAGLVRWTIPRTEIRLHRIASGEDTGNWTVTPESVAELERTYRRVRHLPYLAGATEGAYEEYVATPGAFFPPKWAERIPAWATPLVGEQALWQWIALLLSHIFFAGFLFAIWLLCKRISEKASPFTGQILKIIPPIALAVGTFFMGFLVESQLNITGELYLSLRHILAAVQGAGWVWFVVRLAELLAEMIILSPRIEPGSVRASFVRTMSRLAGILMGSGVIMYTASAFGIPLATILTGFGVAGLAVSLAAQPTIENIIGGIILFSDRSVSVGEFCRFGDKAGTIVSIGLRTTKIEAIDQTIVSIPNAQLSKMQITNVSRRSKNLMQKTINLRYETTWDQMRWILASIRDVLHGHPMVYADPAPLVRFEGFGESSLDVLIFAYVKTKKWSELLAIQEDILFRIGEIVEKAGSRFAFPSTTVYTTRDGGLNEEKSAEVEKEVRQWREGALYPFPDTPPERLATLTGNIEYPPRG